MALSILYLVFDLLLGVTAFSPEPRVTWELSEVNLTHFHEPEVFNYSVLLLSEDENVLYVGAREAIFAVNSLDISEKQHELYWKASEDQKNECAKKGKSKQTECFNYVRVLQPLNKDVLYVCGTNAFQPTCDHLNLLPFKLAGRNEDGKGRSPFDPMQSYTSVMIDGELYSGTSFTFLGNEPIIFRQSQQNQLRTEYSVLWLNDPNFVSADVIRHSQNMPKGYDDDKVYFFFTEVSVEFDFVGKVMIPRVARVCKGDQGGLRILQKKWTTFLKATLLCRMPEWNYIFNVVNDVFILKSPNLKEPLIYGVFTAQLNNIGVSAVCAYNMSSVEEVFAKGKYMQSATVEQSDTKWVRFNGEIPKPRPGACINSFDRAMNFNSSLSLPDKTLQFVKDHPLMYDSVTPLGNKPQLVKRDVNYTQIVVDRVKALDGNTYNVMFIGTDEGTLHKAISSEHGMHIIEEIKLFPVSEPIQTLLLSSKEEQRYVYAGSNSGVVQSPVAFCEKYSTCVDCVLARDPYCAWSVHHFTCVNILQEEFSIWDTIQHINGDATSCFGQFIDNVVVAHHKVNLGGTVELKCSPKANLASISWKLENQHLNLENPNYHPLKDSLLIFNVKKEDTGAYYCLSEEKWLHNIIFSHVIVKHVVELQRPLHTTTSPNSPATQREGNSMTLKLSPVVTEGSTTQIASTQIVVTTPTEETEPTSVSWMSVAFSPETHSTDLKFHVEKTSYLTKPNDSSLFLVLFLLFFVLFCCVFAYNCYQGFLPTPCLKFRSTLLPNKPATDFSDSEQGLKETLVEQSNAQNQNGEQLKPSQDTGYETEADYGNGSIPHQDESQKTEDNHNKDKPFDVIYDIKYADSDAEVD